MTVLAAKRIQSRIVLCDECSDLIRVMKAVKVPVSHPDVVEYGGELCAGCDDNPYDEDDYYEDEDDDDDE